MQSVLSQAAYFGVAISLAFYFLIVLLKRRFKTGLLNPLLFSIILTIAALKLLRIDYETYNAGAKYLSVLLTPATICLAIPLYEQFEALKKNALAVFGGILAGVLTSLTTIFVLSLIFHLSHAEYVTFLPKSITTAIGIVLSEENGGFVSVTAAVIIVTGVLGNVTAEWVLKLLRIQEPVARGVAIGTASHAIGTGKAMEMGEVEGAMSSLSIVVAGILTVLGVSLFSGFIQ